MMAGSFHLQAKDPTGATVTLAHLDDLLNGHSAEWVIAHLRKSPSPFLDGKDCAIPVCIEL